MSQAKIEIYTRRFCGYCVRAKMLLDEKGAGYDEISIDADPDLRQTMIRRSAGGTTVPQIFINDQPVGGCMELFALDRSGDLDALLVESE